MRICEHDNCNNPVFSTDKITRKGYCKSHQYKRTDLDKRSIAQKSMDKAKRQIVKVTHKKVDKQDKQELSEWFEMVEKQIEKNPYCWNCGRFIAKPFYRPACAHILPKRKTYGFPSVAKHPLNFVVLGAGCGCHSKYDTSWDDASKMKIWNVAVERFKQFQSEISPEELKNLPEILRAFS